MSKQKLLQLRLRHTVTSVDIFGDSVDTRPPVHQDNLNNVLLLPYSEKHFTEARFEQT